MKKKLTIIFTALTLVVVMLATLCGCSSYNSIKSAFQKEGYEETDLAGTYESYVTAIMGNDYASAASVHCLKKGSDNGGGILDAITSSIGYVVIIEFKSNSDMEEYLKDKVSADDAEDVYEKLQELDTVNGNCFLVVSTLPEGYSIFKSTK